MTNYTHINDCWEAIRQAKTIEEVELLFDTFPRWSGDWEVQIENDSFYNKCYVVYNTYYDKNLDQEETEAETLDIEVEDIDIIE
jgi:hypothetical protein